MKKHIILILLISIISFGFYSFNEKSKGKSNKEVVVQIDTDFGKIKIKLYNKTPKHRDNFIKLAKEGFYNGTLFHRVIKEFMIQGGDPDSKTATSDQPLGGGDVGYRIPAEFDSTLFHKRGALAAARDNNPAKESSGCQFYIVQGKKYTEAGLNAFGKKFTKEQVLAYTTIGGVPFLDGNYTVFGEVIEGLDVVDKIAQVEKNRSDRPLKDIKMTVKVLK